MGSRLPPTVWIGKSRGVEESAGSALQLCDGGTRLDSFRGDAQFSTWLTRVVINEARARVRRRRPTTSIEDADEAALQPDTRIIQFPNGGGDANPEAAAARTQVRELIERGVDELPEDFRVVLVMRDIEGMSVEETASSLKVNPATIKTRLFRARRLMREALKDQLLSTLTGTFPFGGRRCARTADAVLTRLAAQHLKR